MKFTTPWSIILLLGAVLLPVITTEASMVSIVTGTTVSRQACPECPSACGTRRMARLACRAPCASGNCSVVRDRECPRGSRFRCAARRPTPPPSVTPSPSPMSSVTPTPSPSSSPIPSPSSSPSMPPMVNMCSLSTGTNEDGKQIGICSCTNGDMESVVLLQRNQNIPTPPSQSCLNRCYDIVLDNLCERSTGDIKLFRDQGKASVDTCCERNCRGQMDEANGECI